MWVPMDDHNTMIYNWMLAVDEDKPLTPEFIANEETSAADEEHTSERSPEPAAPRF
jgi:hypothetical protein